MKTKNLTFSTAKLLAKVTLSLGIAASLGVIAWGESAVAQSTSADPLEEDFPTSEQDSIFGGSDSINPFDLIHNVNLANGQSPSEFREGANENLESAAEDFRQQQLQKFQELEEEEIDSEDN